jgi:hypothetical protein
MSGKYQTRRSYVGITRLSSFFSRLQGSARRLAAIIRLEPNDEK